MKKKTFGLFIGTILLGTITPTIRVMAETSSAITNETSIKKSSENTNISISQAASVPISTKIINNDSSISNIHQKEEHKELSNTTAQGESNINSGGTTLMDVASGTFGTSQWTINDSGTLTINSGAFDNVTDGKSPWNSYKDQIKTIVFTGQVLAAPDSSMLFGDMSSLTNIEGSENLNTSNVTSMQSMFYNCSSLVSIDVSNWDTANVTNFSAMFASCSSLSSLDVSNWNTTKGTKMTATFLGCGSLSSLDLSNWNTINVTDMAGMFSFCSALKKLTLGYNFSFQNNSSLPDLKVDDKYTGKWQNIGNGTDEKPIGDNIWTSDQLMTNYKRAVDADTYVWQPKIPGKNVTVKYVDENGKEIASTVTLTGNVGETYTSKQETIKGYTFKKVQGNATGTFSDQPQTVTYVYTKAPVLAKDVTVKYVDVNGKEIGPSVTLTGNVGDSYTSKQETIKGYTFKEVQGNTTGTFSDQAQTVTYVYTKDPVPAKDVTVKYVDENGKEIASTVTLTGNVGDSYTSKQETIKGYTFKEVQGNATGTFSNQVQTVTYVYRKNNVIPIPKPNEHSNYPISSKDNHNKTGFTSENENILPQTGDNEVLSNIGMIFGLLVILGTILIVIFKRKDRIK